MRKLLITAAVITLPLAPVAANAHGCLMGAAMGGAAGHLVHHTFIGLFGGCAGGLMVHHLYASWKRTHPDGTMQQFVEDNRDKLPSGWAHRLSGADTADLPAGQ